MKVSQSKKPKKKAGSKGKKSENLYKKWLENQGYLCHKAAPGSLFNTGSFVMCRSNDIFGCIDILAIKPTPPAATIAAQLTTQDGRSARKAKLAAIKHWPESWSIVLVTHEVIKEAKKKAQHRWKCETLLDENRWSDIFYIDFQMSALTPAQAKPSGA